jgi:hypothetical protein
MELLSFSEIYLNYWTEFEAIGSFVGFFGCTKLRNEIETQRTKRNETKYYETQRNILKCETKRKYTKIQ